MRIRFAAVAVMEVVVCVRLDEETLGHIDERAAADGRNRSDWLRETIGAAVAERESA